MIIQLLLNIFISSSIYFLLSISFTFIYYPTKYFHLAHVAIITLGAYVNFLFSKQLGLSLWLFIPSAIVGATAISVISEISVYKPLRNRNATPLIFLITSLGLFIILQNLMPPKCVNVHISCTKPVC